MPICLTSVAESAYIPLSFFYFYSVVGSYVCYSLGQSLHITDHVIQNDLTYSNLYDVRQFQTNSCCAKILYFLI